MARRYTDPGVDSDRIAKQVARLERAKTLSAERYGWPNDHPLKMWDRTFEAIAEAALPQDPFVTIDKIKRLVTSVALGDEVDASEFAQCGPPEGVKILQKTVIPGIQEWIQEFPEDKPQRVEIIMPQGDN